MVGFIPACLGHRYRAVAGSNPALPTIKIILFSKISFTNQHIGNVLLNSSEGKTLGIEAQTESLEESIFKTLSSQKRRDILRFIGEHKQASFTEIKKAVAIEDSSSVSYHLNSLQTLVIQQKEKYALSDLGQEAYSLIIKTNAYTANNIAVKTIRRQLFSLIIVNAVLWAAALFAVIDLEGARQVASLFISLWAVGNILIYLILKQTTGGQTCRW
jgi:DNA-binding transcriptional ArsR family regulator